MYAGRTVSGSSQVLSHVIDLKSIWVSYREVERPVRDVHHPGQVVDEQEYRQIYEIPSITVIRL